MVPPLRNWLVTHGTFWVERECNIRATNVVQTFSKWMISNEGKEFRGKLVSPGKAPRRRPVHKEILLQYKQWKKPLAIESKFTNKCNIYNHWPSQIYCFIFEENEKSWPCLRTITNSHINILAVFVHHIVSSILHTVLGSLHWEALLVMSYPVVQCLKHIPFVRNERKLLHSSKH